MYDNDDDEEEVDDEGDDLVGYCGLSILSLGLLDVRTVTGSIYCIMRTVAACYVLWWFDADRFGISGAIDNAHGVHWVHRVPGTLRRHHSPLIQMLFTILVPQLTWLLQSCFRLPARLPACTTSWSIFCAESWWLQRITTFVSCTRKALVMLVLYKTRRCVGDVQWPTYQSDDHVWLSLNGYENYAKLTWIPSLVAMNEIDLDKTSCSHVKGFWTYFKYTVDKKRKYILAQEH